MRILSFILLSFLYVSSLQAYSPEIRDISIAASYLRKPVFTGNGFLVMGQNYVALLEANDLKGKWYNVSKDAKFSLHAPVVINSHAVVFTQAGEVRSLQLADGTLTESVKLSIASAPQKISRLSQDTWSIKQDKLLSLVRILENGQVEIVKTTEANKSNSGFITVESDHGFVGINPTELTDVAIDHENQIQQQAPRRSQYKQFDYYEKSIFSIPGNLLLLGNKTGSVEIIDARTGNRKDVLYVGSGFVFLSRSLDKQFIVAATQYGKTIVLKAASLEKGKLEVTAKFDLKKAIIEAPRMLTEARCLVNTGNEISSYDVSAAKSVRLLKDGKSALSEIETDQAGKTAVVSSSSGRVFKIDL